MARRWAPLAAAMSVVAIAVTVSLVAGRSGGQPPVLRLASGAGHETGVAADAPLAAGATSGGNAAFELVGPLPSGPDEARAHILPRGAADADDVRRLAVALGVVDVPKRVAGGWRAGALRVRDDAGNPWFLYAGEVCGPDQAVSSSDSVSAVGCTAGGVGTVDSGTDSVPVQPTPPPAVDIEAARTVAAAILQRLGLGDAEVSVQGGGTNAFVQAAPRVDGLRTSGYDTSLEIDADGKVFGGNGFLGRPTDGATYPIVSATSAYKALPEPPRPMYLCPADADCPKPQPQRITGAALGLMFTPLADSSAALLPAWLFTVEGWGAPLAQPAIEPRFLQLPEPIRVQPGGGEPVPPAPAEPPMPAPSASRASFGFDSVFPTDNPNVVIVQYGDSGSCPHTDVTHQVKESSDSVVVLLEADAMQTKQVCTDDYRQQLVTVKLQAPLGDRTVIDGSRGEQVAIDRTCARPMGQPSPPKRCS